MHGAEQKETPNLSSSEDVAPAICPESKTTTSIRWSSNRSRGLKSLADLPLQYIISYRAFIQKHRLLLRFVEDGLSRLVLYTPTRFVAHVEGDIFDKKGNRKILPETLYALIHLWSLLNDILYHGFGKGNGFTVGTLHDGNSFDCVPLSSFRDKETKVQQFTTTAYTTILLRSILSVVECLSPALEVSAYYSNIRTKLLDQPGIRRNDTDWNQSERHVHALEVSTKLETLKFMCRLGLIAVHYGKYLRSLPSHVGNHEKMMKMLSGMGILQNGGVLEPNEHVTLTRCENDRVKRLLYVGRRTGKQVGFTNRNRLDTPTISPLKHPQAITTTPNVGYIRSSPCLKMLMIMSGELLHIYRPFYFIQSLLKFKKGEHNSPRKTILKSWIISLLMDILSQKLTLAGKMIHRNDHHHSYVDTCSESTKNELYHRKMKWVLYLLRAPVWDRMTHPLLEKIGHVMDYVPFIGKPLAQYIMDVVSYWEKWHFMLE